MSERAEKVDKIQNVLIFIILLINFVLLYLYPDPVTGMFVIALTGGYVLLTQFREFMK